MSAKPKLGRPRKRGRPRKQPGDPVDHRLTPKVRIAILAIVEDGKSRAEAAALAGMTSSALGRAMRGNSVARDFYVAELRALVNLTKAKAVHTLIKELDGPNAAARVAAARTLLEDHDKPSAGNNMPQVPGFAILIADQRSSQHPIDITPVDSLPMVRAPRLDG